MYIVHTVLIRCCLLSRELKAHISALNKWMRSPQMYDDEISLDSKLDKFKVGIYKSITKINVVNFIFSILGHF